MTTAFFFSVRTTLVVGKRLPRPPLASLSCLRLAWNARVSPSSPFRLTNIKLFARPLTANACSGKIWTLEH